MADPASQLDPELKARLLQEARTPWRGLRRALWLALFASAAVGAATMALRASSGGVVPLSDLGIQGLAIETVPRAERSCHCIASSNSKAQSKQATRLWSAQGLTAVASPAR